MRKLTLSESLCTISRQKMLRIFLYEPVKLYTVVSCCCCWFSNLILGVQRSESDSSKQQGYQRPRNLTYISIDISVKGFISYK